MGDELYDEIRQSGLGRGLRLALFSGVLLLGLVVLGLHLTGVLTSERRFLLGPVLALIGGSLLVMELRRGA